MEKLNVYLANLAVGNIKLHNLHWNVKGFSFKQVHEYLEALYDNAFEKFDEVAELQKMHGIDPLASMKEYLEITTVEELETQDYDLKDAIGKALEYVELMRELALEIRAEADECDKFSIANMMEDHIESYDKEIWFMKSMLS
ncbi:MAG: DNA starvation/stationary phase protection protein [Tissierellia bacterium]|nr:DNA starvation/stationary phase protection protein [Tissierellia bacterium]